MGKATEFLSSHQSATPSGWKKDAQWRRDNSRWLCYSRYITMRIMQEMDEQGVTQTALAQRIGCTQQYVSNLLKGSSNMTLETIARIEDALDIDLVKSALSTVDGYSAASQSRSRYLSDVEQAPYGNPPAKEKP